MPLKRQRSGSESSSESSLLEEGSRMTPVRLRRFLLENGHQVPPSAASSKPELLKMYVEARKTQEMQRIQEKNSHAKRQSKRIARNAKNAEKYTDQAGAMQGNSKFTDEVPFTMRKKSPNVFQNKSRSKSKTRLREFATLSEQDPEILENRFEASIYPDLQKKEDLSASRFSTYTFPDSPSIETARDENFTSNQTKNNGSRDFKLLGPRNQSLSKRNRQGKIFGDEQTQKMQLHKQFPITPSKNLFLQPILNQANRNQIQNLLRSKWMLFSLGVLTLFFVIFGLSITPTIVQKTPIEMLYNRKFCDSSSDVDASEINCDPCPEFGICHEGRLWCVDGFQFENFDCVENSRTKFFRTKAVDRVINWLQNSPKNLDCDSFTRFSRHSTSETLHFVQEEFGQKLHQGLFKYILKDVASDPRVKLLDDEFLVEVAMPLACQLKHALNALLAYFLYALFFGIILSGIFIAIERRLFKEKKVKKIVDFAFELLQQSGDAYPEHYLKSDISTKLGINIDISTWKLILKILRKSGRVQFIKRFVDFEETSCIRYLDSKNCNFIK